MAPRILLAAICLSAALAAVAQPHPPAELPPVPLRFSDLLAQVASARSAPHAAVEKGDAEGFLVFPLVGNAPGSGGTYFRTEVTINNFATHAQDVVVYFFPLNGGASNCNYTPKRFHFDASYLWNWPDVVTQLAGESGLGALVISAVRADGTTFDASARLSGTARIYTTIPRSRGTASQSFNAQPFDNGAGWHAAVGLRQDTDFRTNIGIFNEAELTRTFDIRIYGTEAPPASMTITMQPCTVTLVPAAGGNLGSMMLYVNTEDGTAAWYAFASSVDNVSGDAWSAVAHPY